MTPTIIRYLPTPTGFKTVATYDEADRWGNIEWAYAVQTYVAADNGTTSLDYSSPYSTQDAAIAAWEQL
jgi:hypothetical protein